MLNDVIIDKLSDRLVKRINAGNEYVLQQIGKKLKEIKDLTPEQAQKLANVLKYGGDYNKIANELSKITNLNKKDIYKIFDEVAKKDYRFAKQFYEYRKKKYIPYAKNTELKRLVKAIADKTANQYLNIAGSKNIGLGIVNPKTKQVEFKVLKSAYNNLIDEAILNVSTGKETFDTMMKKTLNELDKGLKVIYKYKDKEGKTKYYKKSLDSAVREQMSDGLSQLQQEMQKQVGAEFDSDGVEITVVYNPAPDHAEVQGKQFKNEEFEKFQNDETATSYDGVVFEPEYDGRDRRSIGQYNCRHLVYSIILGVNKPQYSNKQLKEIIDKNNKGFEFEGKHYTNYEASQLQRRLESEIRKNKLEQISARARGDMESVDKAQGKVSALNKKYKQLCNAGKLTPRNDLLSVSGYRKVSVNRAYNNTLKPNVDVKDNAVMQAKTPKTTQKEIKTLDEWQKHFAEKYGSFDIINGVVPYNEKLLPDIELDENLGKIEKEFLDENLTQLERLLDKYKIAETQGLEIMLNEFNVDKKNWPARTNQDGTIIELSKNWFLDKNKYVKAEKHAGKINWHIRVADEDLPIYTITHEFGHVIEGNFYRNQKYNNLSMEQIDTFLRINITSEVAKETGLSLSDVETLYFSNYAKSEENFEWFAEGFVNVELGKQNPFTKAFKKWLKENIL